MLLRAAVALFVALQGESLWGQAGSCPADSALPRDTLTITLGLRIPEELGIPLEVHRDYLYFAQDIAANFRPPALWQFPRWPGTYAGRSAKWLDEFAPALGAEGLLVVRVSKEGRVQRAAFTAQGGAPTLESALLSAVYRADTAGLLIAPAADPRQRSDTTVALQVTAGQAGELGFVPFARFRLAAVSVDQPPGIRRIPKPPYPGSSGSVILQYVIGPDGRAEQDSFAFLYADRLELGQAAAAAIRRGEFNPAQRGTCAVRMLVSQRVTFR